MKLRLVRLYSQFAIEPLAKVIGARVGQKLAVMIQPIQRTDALMDTTSYVLRNVQFIKMQNVLLTTAWAINNAVLARLIYDKLNEDKIDIFKELKKKM